MPISKAQIKYLQSLKLKKYRLRYNKFIVEGDKMVREAIRDIPARIQAVYGIPDWSGWSDLNVLHPFEKNLITTKELERISSQKVPNQAVALVDQFYLSPNPEKLAAGLSLYLDNLQDPGNLGTILRSADWFGVAAVFLSPLSVEVFNPKVIQSTMGSAWRVPIEMSTLQEVKQKHPHLKVIGSSLKGTPIKNWKAKPGTLFIVGNESKGISEETVVACDELLLIPGAPSSQAESLNAGVSAGILCALWANSVQT